MGLVSVSFLNLAFAIDTLVKFIYFLMMNYGARCELSSIATLVLKKVQGAPLIIMIDGVASILNFCEMRNNIF